MMRAAILRDVDDLRVEELPAPSPGADEVLVRVAVCGVCATDVNMWRGTNLEGTFPFVPGHEWAGEIVETGSEVKKNLPSATALSAKLSKLAAYAPTAKGVCRRSPASKSNIMDSAGRRREEWPNTARQKSPGCTRSLTI
jgi:NADPH:quinone reductase-like Zn-dependent oxidoreductase